MKIYDWLSRRTRLLNVFHFLRLAKGHSQMNQMEREVLKRYADGKTRALEVGTYMGVSANIIAKVLDPTGILYCVDPFLDRKGSRNPGLAIAERDLNRNGIIHRVSILKGYSSDMNIQLQIPDDLDFIFIDGDHRYEGLENDWKIVKSKLRVDGIVCLHDTIIPKEEPYRDYGSVKYFQNVILKDMQFKLIDQSYSMTVLKRVN
jgi:predicted O-methyltransferase YrrM